MTATVQKCICFNFIDGVLPFDHHRYYAHAENIRISVYWGTFQYFILLTITFLILSLILALSFLSSFTRWRVVGCLPLHTLHDPLKLLPDTHSKVSSWTLFCLCPEQVELRKLGNLLYNDGPFHTLDNSLFYFV